MEVADRDGIMCLSIWLLLFGVPMSGVVGLDIHLGVLMPFSGPKVFGPEAINVIEKSVTKLNDDQGFTELRRHGVKFRYTLQNSNCDTGHGLFELVEMIKEKEANGQTLHAFLGPVCDDVCEAAGLLAAKWKIPMISFGCAQTILSDVKNYPTFVRVSATYVGMMEFIEESLSHFHWDRLVIAEGAEKVWREAAEGIDIYLEGKGYTVELFSIFNDMYYLKPHLTKHSKSVRVFLICAYPRDILAFLCAASQLGFMNGEFVFMTIDFGLAVDTSDMICPINVTNGILDFTWNIASIDENITNSNNSESFTKNGLGLHLIYDAFNLYATAVENSLAAGYGIQNTTSITERMRNTSLFYLIASIAVVVGVLLTMVLSCICGYLYVKRKKKLYEELNDMDWKISAFELESCNSKVFHSMSSKLSFNVGDFKDTRSQSCRTDDSKQHTYTKTALYRGSVVAIKAVGKPFISLTSAVIQEINQVRMLKHSNLHLLIGACVDPMNIMIISLYCTKGSLIDVLENTTIRLDWIFKLSFASDIAKGMSYLHNSSIQSHGKLRSSNVYIDSRWICRVGDIPLPNFCAGEKDIQEKDAKTFKLLWVAPELLREGSNLPRGTQKGDVYSYAIILQEIILRAVPYENESISPSDIIARVMKLEHPPFRPKVPVTVADRSILEILRMCWEEVPMFRPDFNYICDALRKSNRGKKTNLVDQMMYMMEKYTDHLEELVGERTCQLEDEQKRTEELLHRMLPKSIANDLKFGKVIEPETYDCVTIFFSDIVQFTALSAESTPMEIVNFLNDLYTCFDGIIESYNVYKVETIGDAYMVVSGLPDRNGLHHASEIATMALELLCSVTTFKIRHRPNRQLQLRIGIHSGPVCAGVVGLKMPRYCLFGDTVNHASRMESSGVGLQIHVSQSCRDILKELGGFHLTYRGQICIKGKGLVHTYFLNGKDGFRQELPNLNFAIGMEEYDFK